MRRSIAIILLIVASVLLVISFASNHPVSQTNAMTTVTQADYDYCVSVIIAYRTGSDTHIRRYADTRTCVAGSDIVDHNESVSVRDDISVQTGMLGSTFTVQITAKTSVVLFPSVRVETRKGLAIGTHEHTLYLDNGTKYELDYALQPYEV